MEKDLNRNESLAKEYHDLLWPQGHLVAVKLLKNSEVEKMGEVSRPERRVTLCQLLAQAHYMGRTSLVGPDDQSCWAPQYFLGLKEFKEKEPWKRWIGWEIKTEELAKKTFENYRSLPTGKYSAVLISPLEICPVAPDVMIFIGNAAQMLAIFRGYLYDREGPFIMENTGMGGCNVIPGVMLDKKPKIFIPGGGWKALALPSDTSLICGLPGEMLEGLAENMRVLKSRGGMQYPTQWPWISVEPQPPIADLIKPFGVNPLHGPS
jgi:uncharacterized protein (DUF169 family)